MSDAQPLDLQDSISPIAWIALTPAIVGVGCLVAPSLRLPDWGAAMFVFGGAVLATVVPLTVAARAFLTARVAVAVALLGSLLVGVVVLVQLPSRVLVVGVDTGLVLVAAAIGGSIGRRVAHAGHLLPAAIVAAAADLASVVMPEGPTHAIASSQRALSVLAIGFAIPGTRDAAPALGVGDALFVALVLGVAATHRLSRVRVALAAAAGLVTAGGLSAWLDTPIPALVPLGAFVVAFVPAARKLRAADRRTTQIAAILAASVVAAVIARRLLGL